jgi:oligogalacturonide lyase
MNTLPVATEAGRHLQLLYFTSTSLSDDGRHLVAIGERQGQPDLCRVDLDTGQVSPLTAHDDGTLRSYVYFDGQPHRGFGKASVSFDARRGVLYYLHGDEIRSLALDGTSRTLARLPDDQVTAFTHVSSDGRLLCVPTTDARAFTEDADWQTPHKGIDARVRRLGLSSWLRIYDTATGELLGCEEVPGGWVTHVQFSPRDARHILYNHEWPDDCGIRRVWLWDGTAHRALRTEGYGRSRNDWTCHEMWERDGRAVIYHGRYVDGRAYIGRVGLDGAAPREIALPKDWTRYGHFTVGPDESVLVTDGYYRAEDGDDAATCPWISRLDVDWKDGAIRWRVLGRSDSSWDSQDSHPHPILDRDGRFVYFTTDRNGRREVHRLPAGAGTPVAELRLTDGVAEPA